MGWTEKAIQSKPAKYKVGDIVDMYWDYESIATFFYQDGGDSLNEYDDRVGVFTNPLGKVEILSVEKITIRCEKDTHSVYSIFDEFGYISKNGEEQFAKEEGFVDVNNMFKFFNEWLDLSTPREMWTYTFRWL